jgi:hypothetical protein
MDLYILRARQHSHMGHSHSLSLYGKADLEDVNISNTSDETDGKKESEVLAHTATLPLQIQATAEWVDNLQLSSSEKLGPPEVELSPLPFIQPVFLENAKQYLHGDQQSNRSSSVPPLALGIKDPAVSLITSPPIPTISTADQFVSPKTRSLLEIGESRLVRSHDSTASSSRQESRSTTTMEGHTSILPTLPNIVGRKISHPTGGSWLTTHIHS